jgi:outer membrane cobalamin receptor
MKSKILLFCLLFCSQILLSQSETNDSIKSYSLDEIQITGKKNAAEIIPPHKLSGVVLHNLSSQSVADAVRFFSGIQVKDYGGIGGLKTINIRSMGTNQMGVFYDGIQLGNAQNGQVDLGRFSIDNIGSISIYNGQKSSMLQSAKDYGAAGTIYIQTVRPKFLDNKNFNFAARVKGGSFGLINPSVLFQQKIKKLFDLSLSAEFLNANGKYNFHYTDFANYDTVVGRKNADITALRTEAAIFGYFADGNWKLQIYNYNSERGLPGYVGRDIYNHFERQRDNNFFMQGTVKKNFGKYSMLFNAKYADDYMRYTNPDTTTRVIDIYYRQREVYLSMANAFQPFRVWETALSVDFQYNTLLSDRSDFTFPSRCTLLTALSSSLKLSFVRLQASLLGTFVKDEVKNGVAQQHKAVFTPAVTASFSPFRRTPLNIRAFCKRIFRLPTFNDLYYTLGMMSYLKPEFVQQYDVGAEYILKKGGKIIKNMNVSVDFYYNYVENKIVALMSSNAFRWQMLNMGKVKVLGTDFAADVELLLHKNLSLNILANYSFQDARNFTDKNDKYYRHLLPYSPQHCATLAANITFKNLRFNYCFIYTGERYAAGANIAMFYVRPFQTHDISAKYTFNIKRKQFMVNLDINNIFNQQYEVVLNYPMPGTNFKIGLSCEF